MGGVPSKSRLIADRVRLARMISEFQVRQPTHLSDAERSQLIDSLARRVERLEEEISTLD